MTDVRSMSVGAGLATLALLATYIWLDARETAAPAATRSGASQRTSPEGKGVNHRPPLFSRSATVSEASNAPASSNEQPAANPATTDEAETESTEEKASLDPDALYARNLQELYARLERRLESERVDPSWRREAEIPLREVLEALDPERLQVDSIDCREDICKTSLRHETAQMPRELALKFVTSPDGPIGFEHHFRYDNGKTTIYSLQPKRTEAVLEE